ncbi:MAG: MTH938/NDUFAF3 family protein [Proteobacteria bacterium]|nr:MTH938/NDUFAF3 family protein [Pseudomonadota bacterium]
MDLIENKDGDSNLISSINETSVVINDTNINESCIVSNKSIHTELNIRSIVELGAHHIEKLLSSNPELILIGSGNQHIFPNTSLLAPIAKKHIGFEVMNNQSASRTYNVLVAEERQVACLIIIETA